MRVTDADRAAVTEDMLQHNAEAYRDLESAAVTLIEALYMHEVSSVSRRTWPRVLEARKRLETAAGWQISELASRGQPDA